MKALIVFYSAYGHIYKMAQAMAEGVSEVEGAKVEIKKVRETLPADVLEKTGIAAAQKAFGISRLLPLKIWKKPTPSFWEHRHDSETCALRCVRFSIPRARCG